jgi:hypothetical protein
VRTILFSNNVAAATTLTWSVTTDCVLKYVIGTTSISLLTTDPSLTSAIWNTPTELISTGKDVVAIPFQTSNSAQLNIPFKKGSQVFLQLSAVKQNVVLLVEDDIPS